MSRNKVKVMNLEKPFTEADTIKWFMLMDHLQSPSTYMCKSISRSIYSSPINTWPPLLMISRKPKGLKSECFLGFKPIIFSSHNTSLLLHYYTHMCE
jgi:hypothetical protein